MTTPDQDLREKAEAATGGPWVVRETMINGVAYGGHWVEAIDTDPEDARYPERLVQITGSGGARSFTTRIFERQIHDDNEANARFVAAANPATILALLDRIESAERALEPFVVVADAEDEAGRDDPDDDRIWVVQAYGCQLADFTIEDFRAARAHFQQNGDYDAE